MIQFKNYSFTYPGCEMPVLNNISLKLKDGGFYLICGASGSGKTTLLLQMKSCMTPHGSHSGEILIGGTPIEKLSPEEMAKQIGFVGQDPDDMIVTDKVWHELAFGLESLSLGQEMKRRVAENAQFFGLDEYYLRDTATLSGGQKQLLSLASVMAMQPQVLILDEPTAQLDPLAASEFIHTLKRINQELGVTIILCEHRLEEVFALCDEILLMEDGKIEIQGEPEQVANYLAGKGSQARLFEGLPAPMRIYHALSVLKEDLCPIHLKQGRLWFQQYADQRETPFAVAEGTKVWNQSQEQMRLEGGFFSYDSTDYLLKGASFCLHKGEWFCLLGGNGAGKSTLLKLLCQTLSLQDGKLFYEGEQIGRRKPIPLGYEGIVYLPQSPKVLFGGITVLEELSMMLEPPYRTVGMEKSAKEALVQNMITKMELESMKKYHPYDLSGGQQQKLALGKLLLLESKVLLLDEPTKGMDPGFKPIFAKMLKEYTNQGGSILMVSHDVEFCAEYGDTCGLLFDGEILGQQDGHSFFAGNSFYTTSTNKMVRSRMPDGITVSEVVKRCSMP